MIPCVDAGHPYSLFPILSSLFPVPCSLFPKIQKFFPHNYDNCYIS
ncbi:MAG: hypothetical protein F6K50_25435 [Moorea sp. SIO3I7]|nr:hypothetical protein [Moorena sp. SIO3I7]NEO04284.1 hypothetical protein [Moorena sp. SIO3I8]